MQKHRNIKVDRADKQDLFILGRLKQAHGLGPGLGKGRGRVRRGAGASKAGQAPDRQGKAEILVLNVTVQMPPFEQLNAFR